MTKQIDYIKQLEEDNELLRKKLEDFIEKYDNLNNNKDNLRQRIREIEFDGLSAPPDGSLSKYKITYQDIQNTKNGVLSYQDLANQIGLTDKDVRKFMEMYMKDDYDV